jgi:hypothetical protein
MRSDYVIVPETVPYSSYPGMVFVDSNSSFGVLFLYTLSGSLQVHINIGRRGGFLAFCLFPDAHTRTGEARAMTLPLVLLEEF